MSNKLTTIDPFRGLARYEPFRNFETFFNDFRLRPMLHNVDVEPMIRMDVAETAEAYTVKAEIPGVPKSDIQVSIDGNTVSISAEIKKEKEEKKDEKVVHSERYYGQQMRRFSLAHDIDESKAVANYKNGVLELTLPKKVGGNGVKTLRID